VTASPAIVARDVTVRFRPTIDRTPTLRRSVARLRHLAAKEVVALDGVDAVVTKGEAFGVIGHNGAGKSTLLRVLAQTLKPDGGSIEVYGRTSTLLQLGVGFNGELSGARNIYLGALAAGLRKAEIDERFEEIVEYAGLWDSIHRPVKTYSSGMFARLAFSVGMSLRPDILLLDEVLAVGDEEFQQKSRASMQELIDRAGTIVFVSHALTSVAEFCDRALWLDDGRVKRIGPAPEVVDEYRSSVSQAAKRKGAPKAGGPYTAHQKSRAVVRLLKGESASAIAEEYGCDVARIEEWRAVFLKAGHDVFKVKRPDVEDGS
jgi:ABC-type polysaccharide/polyol phosphate transport system ATPase subunit